MPVPNDLTTEEEAQFTAMGVAPAGPGSEPTGEPNQPAAEPPSQHSDRQAPVRDEQGRFAQSEQPADPNAPPATPPVDPNAPPVDPNAPPVDPNAPPVNPQQPQPGFVPHAALHAERMRANNLAQQMATLQARTNAVLASRQPQFEELPDLNTDPVGYVQALGERQEQFFRQQQEEQQNQQIHTAIEQDETTFRSYTPDYDQASDHYVQSRAQELLHFYPPQQAQQIMLQEARQMAQEAWQRGIPAAQMVYQLAQARGYRPGGPAPQQMMSQEPNSGYAPPAQTAQPYAPPATVQAPPAQPSATPQQQVAAIRQGQGAARSLSAGGGAASPAQLNAEALLNMSDEEFEAHLGLGQKGANNRFSAIG